MSDSFSFGRVLTFERVVRTHRGLQIRLQKGDSLVFLEGVFGAFLTPFSVVISGFHKSFMFNTIQRSRKGRAKEFRDFQCFSQSLISRVKSLISEESFATFTTVVRPKKNGGGVEDAS